MKKKRPRKRKRKTFFKRRSTQGTIAAVFVIFLSVLFYYIFISQPTNPDTFHFRAVIVDQLGGGHIKAQPNQTFIQAAEEILNASGFSVDYIDGANVTVDFYKDLPSLEYGIIILRLHSATSAEGTREISLFTSELFEENKHNERGLAAVAFVPYEEEDPIYFGVLPLFVRDSMNGKFENTIVIMTGCDGLSEPQMAEAFIARGAKAYLGWNELVTAPYTDYATTRLLQHLMAEKKSMRTAVEDTKREVGGDPTYPNSTLSFYPDDAGDHIIPNATDHNAIQSVDLQQHTSGMKQPFRNPSPLTLQSIATAVLTWHPTGVAWAFHSNRSTRISKPFKESTI